ncbi:endonuclease/exonuclease/phosphatase family [Verrucomicrobiia bacterium DG1235]|nr:endonuclease/exonuclease/phosphatase family [Verrucomicrobiae bacterium DG1235]
MRFLNPLAALFFLVASVSATELTLSTYNLRLEIASDGPNQWENRREQVANQIAFLAPDILGVQEALPQQVDYLEQNLAGYSYIGVGRHDGIRAGEHSAIYYRDSTTELLDSSTFWLSPTPDTPSYGWGVHYRRICTYGHFRDRQTKTTYWVFNTHFDHEMPEARLNGAKLILDRIATLVSPNEPHFLMGDLNATPDSPPIKLISAKLQDTRLHSTGPVFGSEGTFNAFDPTTIPTRRIDYIFASPENTITAYATLSDLIDGRYPSDHFPIVIKTQLQN